MEMWKKTTKWNFGVTRKYYYYWNYVLTVKKLTPRMCLLKWERDYLTIKCKKMLFKALKANSWVPFGVDYNNKNDVQD